MTGRVMRSYPEGRSRWYRCGYGLFRDVSGEQITFCFGNLTVPRPFFETARPSDVSLRRAAETLDGANLAQFREMSILTGSPFNQHDVFPESGVLKGS